MIDIPEEEKKKFLKKLDANPKFRRKVGETLVLLLDRLDDMEKPELVGKLFKAYMLGRIEFPAFQRLAAAVERAYLPDLFELKGYYDGQSSDDAIAQRLASHGLLHFSVEVLIGGGKIRYSISGLGELLVEICWMEK